MASRGKDFEYVLVYEAWNFAGKTGTNFNDIKNKYDSADQIVKNTNPLEFLFDELSVQIYADKLSMADSFQLLGGRNPEPKTDVMFVYSGKTYKLSMKWGDSFQASSAGVEGTNMFLEKVIRKVASEQDGNVTAMGEVIAVMDQLDGFLGESKVANVNAIQSKLSAIREEDGLQSRLQEVLGSSREPNVSEAFYSLKKAVMLECITGELTFSNKPNNIANYVFTGKPSGLTLTEITDSYIRDVMSKSSVRISAKGRGTKGSGGEEIRYQEAVIRFDLKD